MILELPKGLSALNCPFDMTTLAVAEYIHKHGW